MAKTVTSTPSATDERRPDFVVHTAPLAVKHDGAEAERPMLICTASSTAIDLESDRFTKSALEQMRDGFMGKVIFMNHSYRVPLDVFGVVEEASLVKREGRLDLDLAIRVETGNPLAVQTYGYVATGTRLGVSVGVIVTEHDKSDDEDEFGNRVVDISGVIPLEASVVGIPCNQTAWTQEAIKSLHARGAIDFDEDELAARPWLITAADIDRKEGAMPKTTETQTDDSAEEDETDADAAAASSDESSDDASADDDSADDADSTDSDSTDASTGDGADSADDSDETKDQEGEDEEGGGDDEHDDDDGDGEHKEDAEEPDEAKGESKTDDFNEEVDVDLAADELLNKMYSGFYTLLRNLVPTLMDTDVSMEDRRKQGEETIADYAAFLEKVWGDTFDELGEKSVSSGDDIDIAARLHDLAAAAASVDCEVAEVAEVMVNVAEIMAVAEEYVEENKRLREEVETKSQGLEYAAQVVEAVMDLPLPTVTAEVEQVARNLAERYPNLDTKVRDRLVRFAPKRRNQ